jgi:hypothetical protein
MATIINTAQLNSVQSTLTTQKNSISQKVSTLTVNTGTATNSTVKTTDNISDKLSKVITAAQETEQARQAAENAKKVAKQEADLAYDLAVQAAEQARQSSYQAAALTEQAAGQNAEQVKIAAYQAAEQAYQNTVQAAGQARQAAYLSADNAYNTVAQAAAQVRDLAIHEADQAYLPVYQAAQQKIQEAENAYQAYQDGLITAELAYQAYIDAQAAVQDAQDAVQASLQAYEYITQQAGIAYNTSVTAAGVQYDSIINDLNRTSGTAVNQSVQEADQAQAGAIETAAQNYNAAVQAADTTHAGNILAAGQNYYAAVQTAMQAYQSAIQAADDAYASALEQTQEQAESAHDAAIQTADDAYLEAVQAAGQAYQSEVQPAILAAEQAIQARDQAAGTLATAGTVRDEAAQAAQETSEAEQAAHDSYTGAVSTRDSALANANALYDGYLDTLEKYQNFVQTGEVLPAGYQSMITAANEQYSAAIAATGSGAPTSTLTNIMEAVKSGNKTFYQIRAEASQENSPEAQNVVAIIDAIQTGPSYREIITAALQDKEQAALDAQVVYEQAVNTAQQAYDTRVAVAMNNLDNARMALRGPAPGPGGPGGPGGAPGPGGGATQEELQAAVTAAEQVYQDALNSYQQVADATQLAQQVKDESIQQAETSFNNALAAFGAAGLAYSVTIAAASQEKEQALEDAVDDYQQKVTEAQQAYDTRVNQALATVRALSQQGGGGGSNIPPDPAAMAAAEQAYEDAINSYNEVTEAIAIAGQEKQAAIQQAEAQYYTILGPEGNSNGEIIYAALNDRSSVVQAAQDTYGQAVQAAEDTYTAIVDAALQAKEQAALAAQEAAAAEQATHDNYAGLPGTRDSAIAGADASYNSYLDTLDKYHNFVPTGETLPAGYQAMLTGADEQYAAAIAAAEAGKTEAMTIIAAAQPGQPVETTNAAINEIIDVITQERDRELQAAEVVQLQGKINAELAYSASLSLQPADGPVYDQYQAALQANSVQQQAHNNYLTALGTENEGQRYTEWQAALQNAYNTALQIFSGKESELQNAANQADNLVASTSAAEQQAHDKYLASFGIAESERQRYYEWFSALNASRYKQEAAEYSWSNYLYQFSIFWQNNEGLDLDPIPYLNALDADNQAKNNYLAAIGTADEDQRYAEWQAAINNTNAIGIQTFGEEMYEAIKAHYQALDEVQSTSEALDKASINYLIFIYTIQNYASDSDYAELQAAINTVQEASDKLSLALVSGSTPEEVAYDHQAFEYTIYPAILAHDNYVGPSGLKIEEGSYAEWQAAITAQQSAQTAQQAAVQELQNYQNPHNEFVNPLYQAAGQEYQQVETKYSAIISSIQERERAVRAAEIARLEGKINAELSYGLTIYAMDGPVYDQYKTAKEADSFQQAHNNYLAAIGTADEGQLYTEWQEALQNAYGASLQIFSGKASELQNTVTQADNLAANTSTAEQQAHDNYLASIGLVGEAQRYAEWQAAIYSKGIAWLVLDNLLQKQGQNNENDRELQDEIINAQILYNSTSSAELQAYSIYTSAIGIVGEDQRYAEWQAGITAEQAARSSQQAASRALSDYRYQHNEFVNPLYQDAGQAYQEAIQQAQAEYYDGSISAQERDRLIQNAEADQMERKIKAELSYALTIHPTDGPVYDQYQAALQANSVQQQAYNNYIAAIGTTNEDQRYTDWQAALKNTYSAALQIFGGQESGLQEKIVDSQDVFNNASEAEQEAHNKYLASIGIVEGEAERYTEWQAAKNKTQEALAGIDATNQKIGEETYTLYTNFYNIIKGGDVGYNATVQKANADYNEHLISLQERDRLIRDALDNYDEHLKDVELEFCFVVSYFFTDGPVHDQYQLALQADFVQQQAHDNYLAAIGTADEDQRYAEWQAGLNNALRTAYTIHEVLRTFQQNELRDATILYSNASAAEEQAQEIYLTSIGIVSEAQGYADWQTALNTAQEAQAGLAASLRKLQDKQNSHNEFVNPLYQEAGQEYQAVIQQANSEFIIGLADPGALYLQIAEQNYNNALQTATAARNAVYTNISNQLGQEHDAAVQGAQNTYDSAITTAYNAWQAAITASQQAGAILQAAEQEYPETVATAGQVRENALQLAGQEKSAAIQQAESHFDTVVHPILDIIKNIFGLQDNDAAIQAATATRNTVFTDIADQLGQDHDIAVQGIHNTYDAAITTSYNAWLAAIITNQQAQAIFQQAEQEYQAAQQAYDEAAEAAEQAESLRDEAIAAAQQVHDDAVAAALQVKNDAIDAAGQAYASAQQVFENAVEAHEQALQAAEQDYDNSLAAAADTNIQAIETADDLLEQAYQEAVNTRDTAYQAADVAHQATYSSIAGQALQDRDAAVQAAQDAYDQAVAPALAAYQSAQQNLANAQVAAEQAGQNNEASEQDVQEAQQALAAAQQAVQDSQAVLSSATQSRDTAINTANQAYETKILAAGQVRQAAYQAADKEFEKAIKPAELALKAAYKAADKACESAINEADKIEHTSDQAADKAYKDAVQAAQQARVNAYQAADNKYASAGNTTTSTPSQTQGFSVVI